MNNGKAMCRRPRGSGSIFHMKGSEVWWIKYHRNGKPIRESSRSTKLRYAEKLLTRRLAEILTGTYTSPKLEKIRVSELADDLIREHRINGKKSLGHLEARWKLHLRPFFGEQRAAEVTTDRVARYIDSRQEQGAENATINRELSALKRMFNLARQSTPPKVKVVPYLPMLKESNTRTGFLESKQHDRLADACAKAGLWMRAMFEVGHTYGWRHEELLRLRVRQVNLHVGTVRLEPNTTKNHDGREVTLTQPVRELLAQSIHGKGPDAFVFTREDGKPVRDFRGTWANVCCEAGVGQFLCPECAQPIDFRRCAACSREWNRKDLKYVGLIFHDLRRTAARNLRNRGISEGVIMKIGGWRTRSVFDRYAIVSQGDIADAMRKLEAGQQREAKAAEQEDQFGQSLGRVTPESKNSRSSLPPYTPLSN